MHDQGTASRWWYDTHRRGWEAWLAEDVTRMDNEQGWQIWIVGNSSVRDGNDGLRHQDESLGQRDIDTNGGSDRPGSSSDQSRNQFFILACVLAPHATSQ